MNSKSKPSNKTSSEEATGNNEPSYPIFQWELKNKGWYWGNVSKEVLAIAMQNQPDGTFAVRDASTPGDYTLTLRIQGANKLIKIYVKDGHSGFTPSNLEYDSVVDLINHYRNYSLQGHNPMLNTTLKYPLYRSDSFTPTPASSSASSSSTSSSSMDVEESEEGMEEESVAESQKEIMGEMKRQMEGDEMCEAVPARLLCKKLASLVVTCPSEIESNRKALAFVVNHFLENVLAEMFRAENRHNKLQGQIDILTFEHDNHTKELNGHRNSLTLLYAAQQILNDIFDSTDDPKTQKMIETNRALQSKRIEVVEGMKTRVEISLEGITRIKNGLETENDIMIKKYDTLKTRFDLYAKELLPYGVERPLIVEITNYILRALVKETEKLQQNLLKINLVTSPFDWLTRNTDKRYSNDLVQKSLALLKKRGVNNTNGTFLIRPSASRPNCFAMVISMDDEIYNCLIEYKPPLPDSDCCGYAFLNTSLYYTTLSDFIRYYSLVTLYEHNDRLSTVLRIPVLKYLASVRRRQRMSNGPPEDEELEHLGGIELDLAEGFALDEDANFERNFQDMDLLSAVGLSNKQSIS